MRFQRHTSISNWLLAVALVAAMLAAPEATRADWADEARDAAISYADQKKNEFIQDQAKSAVLALYKKLYSSKSKIDRNLSRKLAEVAISLPDLNKLAEDTAEAYGSGDPDKIREANQIVAVKFGEQLSKLGSNAETRKLLGDIIGSADKVKEISDVLGNVAAGTDESRRAAAQYVGETLISLTPAAEVIGFYQSAYGVMKFANDHFVDNQIESLYNDYQSGKLSRDGLIMQLESGTAGYKYVVDNRRRELEEERKSAIGDASRTAGDKVLEHLTHATEREIIDGIVASFDGRREKERKDAAAAAEGEKAMKQADSIRKELEWTAKGRYGDDWYLKDPIHLTRFTSLVHDRLKADGVLDPDDLLHIQLMSKALSIAVIYGSNSKEYAKVLAELADARTRMLETNKGAPCLEGSPTEALATRLWKKGIKLVAVGKTAAALPMLRQSVEFCPDDERSAYLATLGKPQTAQGDRDGNYAGESRLVRPPAGATRLEGALRMTVSAEQVSGSFAHKVNFADGAMRRDGTISGQVSPDGRITARVTGRSQENFAKPRMLQGLGNCPFEGEFSGRITDKTASGAFRTWDTRGKNLITCKFSFTWTAVRK